MTHSESRSLPWIRHQLVELRRQLLAFEQEQAALLAAVAAPYRASARNLLHFSAFHRHNHPGLQLALRQRGLSTLAGCDPHLLASLNSLMAVVLHLCGSRDDDAPPNGSEPPISLGQGHALLRQHSERLLGRCPAVMVTLPATAAEAPALIPELVGAGMDLARINCAQDAQRPCRIAMDLAGPKLWIPALTAKDRVDLAFACQHADLVNYSFVRSEADIACFYRALAASGETCDGLVLKIETHQAFLNLPRLLLAAMGQPIPLGVMIARGDLAVECGWDALSAIQEEILRVCAAAHLPCIWATEVLDTMAHHGPPTRPEITDAAMGARAEGLMLNKGANITEALRTLRRIMADSGISRPDHSTDQAERLLSCHCF